MMSFGFQKQLPFLKDAFACNLIIPELPVGGFEKYMLETGGVQHVETAPFRSLGL